jgi:hypothetical protein
MIATGLTAGRPDKPGRNVLCLMQRRAIMVLSLYGTIRAWRRDVAGEKAARACGDTPLGVG